MNKSNSKITFSLNTTWISAFLIIVGLGMATISSIEFKYPYEWWNQWGKNLVNSLGGVLVSTGLISLFLEISSIQKSVSAAIKDLFCGDMDFHKYTKSELEKLFKSITLARLDFNVQEKEIENSIYKYEKEIFQLIEEPYYEYHNCKTVLYPDSKKKIFRKNVKIDYKMINRSKKEISPKMCWKVYVFGNKSDDEILDDFKVSELILNGKNIDKNDINKYKKIKKIKKENCDTYDYMIMLDIPNNKEHEYKLKCTIDYEIPYNDVTQIYKMTKPCKNFLHEFFMKSDVRNCDKWKMSGNAFAAFYCMEEEEMSRFKVKQSVNESLSVSFRGWTLPGAGYVILSEKINNSTY